MRYRQYPLLLLTVADVRLILVMGPTAAGKTALALALAQHFQTEIVSADSRQVFRELPIGTAQPSAEELQRIPHHFIADRSVEHPFSAADFSREARQRIADLAVRYSTLIVCGGSGMYLQALVEGLDAMPDVPPEVRGDIAHQYQKRGLSWLQDEVKIHDPEYFAVVDTQNPQRLMRALELVLGTGQRMSQLRAGKGDKLPYPVLKIGLDLPRPELYARIDARVEAMIEQGLEHEARAVFPFRERNALQTVGYQEWFDFFDGTSTRMEVAAKIKQHTRQYAKRQLTWFRRDTGIKWFHPGEISAIIAWVERQFADGHISN